MKRILVIEDEPKVVQVLKQALARTESGIVQPVLARHDLGNLVRDAIALLMIPAKCGLTGRSFARLSAKSSTTPSNIDRPAGRSVFCSGKA